MLFNTLTFALFFITLLGLLRFMGHRAGNWTLLLASGVFYGAWDWRFLGLLAFSSVFNFWNGAQLAQAEGASRRRWMVLNVTVNLAVLGFFKYYNFFAESLNAILQAIGLDSFLPVLQIVLPLAISFYTFHCLSYTIDIYRRQLAPSRSLVDFSLYLLLFPHLVAGPIVRAAHLLPQIEQPRRTTTRDWQEGLFLIFWGLFKKCVVADNLAPKADQLFRLQQAAAGEVFLGVLAFAFQIYADFSGYTDMARGTARVLGFHFDLNFRFPYAATDPQDFWRRWHISLSQWLRDYLYISLGGNRRGELRTYLNLMLTMLIGGLWHGAAWNFVLWGGYHGTLLCVHRFYDLKIRPALPGAQAFHHWPLSRFAAVPLMFAFTLYGWLLFRATSFDQIQAFTRSLATFQGGFPSFDAGDLARQAIYFLPMLALDGVLMWRGTTELVFRQWWANSLTYLVLIYLTLFLGASGGDQFIYFNF